MLEQVAWIDFGVFKIFKLGSLLLADPAEQGGWNW